MDHFKIECKMTANGPGFNWHLTFNSAETSGLFHLSGHEVSPVDCLVLCIVNSWLVNWSFDYDWTGWMFGVMQTDVMTGYRWNRARDSEHQKQLCEIKLLYRISLEMIIIHF